METLVGAERLLETNAVGRLVNPTLYKIVERELHKIELLSQDDGLLPAAHLEALEVLARILKQAPPGEDFQAGPVDAEKIKEALSKLGG